VLKEGCEASLEKLCQWIGIVRWYYNQCVAFGRNHPEKLKQESALVLRDLCDTITSMIHDNPWVGKRPSDVRKKTVRDYCKALQINEQKGITMRKKGIPLSFKMGFRRKSEAIKETIKLYRKIGVSGNSHFW